MVEIDKSIITRAETRLNDLQKRIGSESFHSGAGCACEACETRNDLRASLEDAERFPATIERQKDDIESELRRLAG